MAAANFSRCSGRTRPTVDRYRALAPTSKYSAASSAGTEAANLRNGSRCLMKVFRFSVE